MQLQRSLSRKLMHKQAVHINVSWKHFSTSKYHKLLLIPANIPATFTRRNRPDINMMDMPHIKWNKLYERCGACVHVYTYVFTFWIGKIQKMSNFKNIKFPLLSNSFDNSHFSTSPATYEYLRPHPFVLIYHLLLGRNISGYQMSK